MKDDGNKRYLVEREETTTHATGTADGKSASRNTVGAKLVVLLETRTICGKVNITLRQ